MNNICVQVQNWNLDLKLKKKNSPPPSFSMSSIFTPTKKGRRVAFNFIYLLQLAYRKADKKQRVNQERGAHTSSICWRHQEELARMIINHNGGEAAPPNSSVTQTYVAHLIWNKLSSTYSSNHLRAGPLNSAGGSSISQERHLNSVSIARWTQFT